MDQPRMITYKTKDGQIGKVTRDTELPEGAVEYIDPEQYYPSHVATDFTIIIRKILRCLQRWALSVFGCLFPGRGFVQKEPERSTKTAWLL